MTLLSEWGLGFNRMNLVGPIRRCVLGVMAAGRPALAAALALLFFPARGPCQEVELPAPAETLTVVEMAQRAGVRHTYIGHHDPNRPWSERNWIDEQLLRKSETEDCVVQLAQAEMIVDL